jgi:hypothetical protein
VVVARIALALGLFEGGPARSTKGYVNSEYDRFLSRMPIGMAVARLGYADDLLQTEPYLVRPLRLDVPEPGDRELTRTEPGRNECATGSIRICSF